MLDLRLPIGLFFLIVGGILVVFGLVQPVSTLFGTTAVNLNLSWGGVMAVFGLMMFLLSRFDKSEA